MKRASMLGALAIAATGFLFAAPAAHAQVTETSLGPINGVTCLRRDGGSYPENGHFFYCGSSSTAKTLVLNQVKDILAAKSEVNDALSNAGSDFYVFETPMDQVAYFAAPNDPNLSQLKEDFYDEHHGAFGFTQAGMGISLTYIWENYPDLTDSYPDLTAQTSAQLQYTAAHEMGHAFDYTFAGPPTEPSKTAEFERVFQLDKEYMLFNAPTAATLIEEYPKFLVAPNYLQEIFAEEFSDYTSSTADITGVQGAVLNQYFDCTEAYTQSIIDNGREPTSMEYPARCRTDAYTIECEPVKDPTTQNPDWPWGQEVLRCGTANQQLANGMHGTLNGLDFQADPAFQRMKNRKARFYFFRNPTEYDTYFDERNFPHTNPTHPRIWGVTHEDSNDSPVASSIFERDINDDPITNANGDAHHAGLWMDYVMSSLHKISESALFEHQRDEDWTDFNALPNCKNTGSAPYGVFRAYRDRDGLYICNTVINATVGGTPQAGNTVTITFTDSSLNPNPQAVNYTVQAGDTTTDVAGALAAAISANSNLSSAGITASSAANSVSIATASGNATTFAKSTTGSTTLSLPNPQYGRGGALSNKYSGKTNKQVLEIAHPHIFIEDTTIFAEVAADETGNTNGTNQGYDQYVNEFTCMKLLVNRIIKQERLPTTQEFTSAGCPTQ